MMPFAPPALQEPAPAPEALLAEARQLRAQRRWEEAVALYTRVLDQRPDDPQARYERAQTLSWMKRFDEAIRDFRQHRERHPELAAQSEPALARVTAWSKRFREAIAILAPYAARGERQAILDTATFLSWDGQLDRSLAMASAWLQAHGPDRDFLILQGRVSGWRGRHAQARRAYAAALALQPGDPEALRGLAQLDLWGGDPEGAAAQLDHLNAEAARSPETQLLQSQVDQRQGRMRQARKRAEALLGNPEAQEDAESRLRDLAEAQGPWAEWSQIRTDTNEGLRAQAQRLDATVPLREGRLRLGAVWNLLQQTGQPERRPTETTLGVDQPLGPRLGAAAQIGRISEAGGDPATSHALHLGYRAAPGLTFSFGQSFAPNLATPRAADLRTSVRTWTLGGTWVFDQTLSHLGASAERSFLSAGAARTAFRAEGGHRFPLERGELRVGLAARMADQNQTLAVGFFNPERYRYYGATVGATRRREGSWEASLDGWAGRQAVNQLPSQFSWGYTLSGTWTPPGTALALFAAWGESTAGLPVSDPLDPARYRDQTLRFGLRIRGNRWIW